MTISPLGNETYQGLSTDTKPTNVPANAQFYETDTFTPYVADGSGGWKEKSVVIENTYIVYKSGSNYKAKNGNTGVVDIINTTPDLGAILNSCISNLSSTIGGKIIILGGSYIDQTPVTIPTASSGAPTPIAFEGIRSNVRGGGTTILVGSSFPTSRYLFESVSAASSGKTSSFSIKNLFVANPNYARSGTSLQNISAGSTIIDAGLVKFDSDNNIGIPFIAENITTQYLWRGIHLIGYLYWPVIRNYMDVGNNINCVSDTHIIMEKGTHIDYPKGGSFENINLNSVAGGSSGTGSINNAIVFGGAYHNARKIFVDGTKYNNSVFAFMQCFSSTFYGIGSIDLLASGLQGSGFKGTFLLDTNDFSGNAASTTYSTYNLQIYDVYGSPVPYTIAFKNSPFRNRIKVYGFWGNNIAIDDSGAGVENIVEIIEGQQPLANSNAKITSTNSLVSIIDNRVGSKNQGLSTQTGTGTTKTFTIAHGCFTTPSNYYVYPVSSDASGNISVTVDATNLTVTYPFAPPSGSSNVKLSWYASVY